ncbi:MAG: DUF3313 domain-containing protein [Paludibacterium sp.]|uniref:DUF3313 domain-containing protein n=1 Tax=Paludibacterium sp. TaxID=1917523 RepID=UPI0025EA39CB|nr:DUF3313 domain-containing protein [Paludibacterium sp.]MBV8048380.1 DUF3313 domain-containing protein [Paludibacterium sp.]MBV8645892.1 DUF3313 domain-containing protein [Paludibacterium sp.]
MTTPLSRLCAAALLLFTFGAAMAEEPATQPETLLAIPRTQFKPAKDHPGRYYYIKPGADLLQYNQIMVAPLVVLTNDEGKQWRALVSDENSQAGQLFQQTISKALRDKGLAVTDQAGPGVAVLRVAVTHIEQKPEGFVVSDVLPIKMVFNLARRAGGLEKYIVKIATMGQLNDSQSGELVAGSLGLREHAKSGVAPASMTDFQQWLDSWSEDVAEQVAGALPAAHQSTTP